MYRCEICKETVGPNIPRLTHVVYRQRVSPLGLPLPGMQIARELSVCTRCHSIAAGNGLNECIKRHGRRTPADKEVRGTSLQPTPKPVPVPRMPVPAYLGEELPEE